MRKFLFYLVILFITFIVYACHVEPQVESKTLDNQNKIDEALLKTNRFMVRRDQDHIANYVRRRGLEMNRTETGIWYVIAKNAKEEKAVEGDIISYAFKLWHIDGTLLDSATIASPRYLRLGKSGQETGLEQMMYLLGKGDIAKIILPPYMAYGNFGDPEKNIPAGAILIYDIEILNIQP
jgi:FKBP-type peptidyl-prolyl cis-trans isomerase FkpA